jgi:hypothetical protein
MPVDNSVSFTWSKIETIFQSPVRPSQQILRLFTALSRNRRPPRSSSYSICWCFRCRELTRLKDNESKYIELAPMWTLGSALYVEHTGTCYRCRTPWHQCNSSYTYSKHSICPDDQSPRFLQAIRRIVSLIPATPTQGASPKLESS